MALAGARDFPALATSLYFHLREDFAVPHVALRVWGKSVPADFDEAPARGRGAAPPRRHMGAPQCGPAAGNPFVPGSARPASTCARLRWCRSARPRSFGLLALGSEDPKRFYPDMGTLYLRASASYAQPELTAEALIHE